MVVLTGNFLVAKPAFAYGEQATPINLNQLYSGSLLNTSEKYYTFTLTKDGIVTLSMLRNTNSSWYTVLSDTNGSSIEYFSTAYGTTATGYEERQVGIPKGTYIIRVSNNDNGYTTPFKFQVKFTAGTTYEKEQNNTAETANPILLFSTLTISTPTIPAGQTRDSTVSARLSTSMATCKPGATGSR